MGTETNLSGSACRQYEALLEDYLAGDLDSVCAKSAEQHLASCIHCRSAFQDAKVGAQLFRIAAPVLEKAPGAGPEFARLTMARIRMEKERRVAEGASFWQPLASFAWRFAATAILALMILLTYAVRGRGPSRAVVGPIGQQQLSDVFAPDPTREPADQDEFLLMVAETNHVEH
jgi:predicted anti-sigma-YlaC factor YlaD